MYTSSFGRFLAAASLASLASSTLLAGDADSLRVASFNAFLNRGAEGQLIADLSTPDNAQARAVAEILQRVDADVVLLCEFDYDAAGEAAALFQQNYLSIGQNGAAPIEYPHVFLAPSNTGLPSGFDLDNNDVIENEPGSVDYGNDSFGFFEGQFAMLLLSKYPIASEQARTFQSFLWNDMPGALLPDDPDTPEPADWFSPEELQVVRLSSKSHWDVPVLIGDELVHVLCAHPTPPIFDGPEDRNGRRNFDEIRFWADYVAGQDYFTDDAGVTGGLGADERFVILGDYNADPVDGDGVPGAIAQLIENPLVQDGKPRSAGGFEAALNQAGPNSEHVGGPILDTADFTDVSKFFSPSGNLRVDYALPSANLVLLDTAVFWPAENQPFFDLVGAGNPSDGNDVVSSDHRLVYVDVAFGGEAPALPPIPAQVALENLGEDTLPTGTLFEGTEVGGLSALVYDPGTGLYGALSDDRSNINPSRFYNLNLGLEDGVLDPGEIELRDVVTLTRPDGTSYPEGDLDPEGLALLKCGSFYLSSEGDANAGIDPFVRSFSLVGRELASLPVPAKYLTGTPEFGIRQNLAFESLTLSPDESLLYTATENALFQDGPTASTSAGSACRILVYDVATGQPTAEYVYPTEPIAAEPDPPGSFATNGLVELLSLGEGRLLALERSFSVGVGNAIRIFLIDVTGADDVSDIEALADVIGTVIPVQKKLILDLEELGIPLDNVEAMAFGPILPDGRRSIVLASDNNFNPGQFTQVLAFALEDGAQIEPYCFGDAPQTCPCGNEGESGRGCGNSASGGGGLLNASGSTLIGLDDLVLTVSDVPANTSGLIYMGMGQDQTPFGDGQRCIQPGPPGAILRYPVADTGALGQYDLGPGIVSDSLGLFGAAGAITAGSTWNFQGYYRDPQSVCGSAFNLTNAVSITFEE